MTKQFFCDFVHKLKKKIDSQVKGRETATTNKNVRSLCQAENILSSLKDVANK
jgi:hypothetical protein